MQKEIIIKGTASQKVYKVISISGENLNENLMDFLRSKGVPIASSCLGQGLCQKCVINTGLLSCSLTLDAFTRRFPQQLSIEINVSYL